MTNNLDNFSEENFLSGMDKKYPFILPGGYFNSFSSRVMNRMEAEQERAEFKTLASVRKPLMLVIPQNYFASLAKVLEYKYELSAYAALSKTPKPVLGSLPADYFDSLEKKIYSQMELKGELKEFPILASLEKKNSFKVVSEYFDNATDEVKEKIHAAAHRSPGIFEQIAAILFKPKMAFALSFILIIGFTSVWYFSRNSNGLIPSGDCKTLACLEKNELLNDKNMRDFDDESLYEMVDVEMLDKQMAGDDAITDSLQTNGTE